jgi:hypothetical protein
MQVQAVSSDSIEWHHGPDAEQRGRTAREAGFGTLEATLIPHPADRGLAHIRVDRADPRILISGLLMDLIRNGHATGCEIDGDLLRLTAVNGSWVYRVGEHLEDRHAWVAEWPDLPAGEIARRVGITGTVTPSFPHEQRGLVRWSLQLPLAQS